MHFDKINYRLKTFSMECTHKIAFVSFIMGWNASVFCQKTSYGDNPFVGHYLDVGGCKMYYEIDYLGKERVLYCNFAAVWEATKPI